MAQSALWTEPAPPGLSPTPGQVSATDDSRDGKRMRRTTWFPRLLSRQREPAWARDALHGDRDTRSCASRVLSRCRWERVAMPKVLYIGDSETVISRYCVGADVF